MNIISRIRFPDRTETSDLYLKCYQGASINCREGGREVNLTQGSSVSLNTYFNSFYEKFYAKYTNLYCLYYLLKLEGDFQVSLHREVYGRKSREPIYLGKFEQCQLTDYVTILLPELSQNEAVGRVYLEVECLSKHGLFTEGLIATEQNKLREVSLGIVTCTFKKEAYIKNTVNTILLDEFLQDKDFKIFVVDNGTTLKNDEFKDQRVEIIPNRNVGGSGGFNRGLIEALREEKYTHFLLMDDDIELDSETISRLFSLYEYAENDFAIAGSMLDIYERHILYEAGALYGVNGVHRQDHPFSVSLVKSNVDLRQTSSLNLLLLDEDIDYGGFWFFALPKKVVEKIGLLMPFFIKIDDMEYGLRIKNSFGGKVVAFPGLAVWHEPFYAKAPVWDQYYSYRNHLITQSIHKSLEYGSAVKYITKHLILCLLLFDYNSAEMLVKAFEDYMLGPNIILKSKPETLHSQVLELSKSHKSQKSQKFQQGSYGSNKQVEQKLNLGGLRKIIGLITLNGFLLPNFLISESDALIWIAPGFSLQKQWHKAFAAKKVIVLRDKSTFFQENKLNRLAFARILTKWFKVVISNKNKWLTISAEWKSTSSSFVSQGFWHHYLEIAEKS